MGTEGTKKAGCEVSEQGPRGSATQYAQLQAELRYIVNTAETGQQNGGIHRGAQHLRVLAHLPIYTLSQKGK